MPAKGKTTSVLDRIASKYTVNAQSGCWEWTGCRASQAGYPLIGNVDGNKNHPQYAYRILWENRHGLVPTTKPSDGSHRWELHHVCENKLCINPDHVILVTAKEHRAIHKAFRAIARAISRTIEKVLPPTPPVPAEVVSISAVA